MISETLDRLMLPGVIELSEPVIDGALSLPRHCEPIRNENLAA